MIDPLDLTITPIVGEIVEIDHRTIVAPSMEARIAPLWTTPAELEAGKSLIAAIEQEIREESTS